MDNNGLSFLPFDFSFLLLNLLVVAHVYKLLGVELLGYFETKFHVVLDKGFKFLFTYALFLSFIKYVVVVLDYFFYASPEELDHLTHVVCFLPQL